MYYRFDCEEKEEQKINYRSKPISIGSAFVQFAKNYLSAVKLYTFQHTFVHIIGKIQYYSVFINFYS